MAIQHQVEKFSKQDKLEKGLLRTKDGSYIQISRYGKRIDDFWERFSDTDEQDQLKQGLIKMNRTEDYVSIDSLGKIENDDCFVATVVYGNKDTPQVRTLRDFRDSVLMQIPIGRAFVNFYYSGAGKRTAVFIRNSLPSTIPAIRKGLDVLVEQYSKQKR